MNIDPVIFFDKAWKAGPILEAASTPDVRNAVLAFFDGLVTVPYVDPETLEFDGMAVGRTRHTGMDVAIADWLNADPSERRIEIGTWFLYGYWGFMAVESRGICLLMLSVIDQLPRNSQAYMGLILALHSAYCTCSLEAENQARIRNALLRELPLLRHTYPGPRFVDWIEALR